MALLTVAVITHDRATIAQAYQKAAALEPDDLAARAAGALRPTLHPDGTWELVGMAEAIQADERPAAAASLAAQFAELRTMTDDDLLTGAHLTATALSRVPFDSCRSSRAWARWRQVAWPPGWWPSRRQGARRQAGRSTRLLPLGFRARIASHLLIE
ncbi:MAG TPA: hypothetical protein VFV67_01970 [Actinophytocola sp.]|uniref:hypothetical protein n=1 Tax=Actinophytocola sp. TaxID=1872138 RepID=UPI002DB99D54|nr:hypothetical protein [Actinophytocola sp.]HEU5469391.1 hypothetical protein [Actinophytocola sp.]